MSDVKIQFTVDSNQAEAALKNMGVAMTGVETKSKSSALTLGNLKAGWLAAAAVAQQVVKALGASVKAYMDAELAEKKLSDALKISGQYTKDRIAQLNQFAENIQRTTVVEDDQARKLLALAANYGVVGSNMEAVVKGAIGLNRTFGTDQETAVRAVTMALDGNFQMLNRISPAVRNAKTDADKFAATQKLLGDSFINATSETETYAGKMARLKNTFGDMQEIVGKVVLDAIDPLVDAFQDLGDNEDAVKTFSTVITIAFAGIAVVVKAVSTSITGIIRIVKDAGAMFKALFKGDLKAAGEAAKDIALSYKDQAVNLGNLLVDASKETAEKVKQIWVKQEEDKTAALLDGTIQRNEIVKTENQEQGEIQNEGNTAAMAGKSSLFNWEKANQKERADYALSGAADMFGNLSSLQKSKNKEMFAIGKAAAIAQATIQTYMGATAAFASLAAIPVVGPALGIAAAAAAVAAGLMNIATIAAEPPPAAAMGGIVPASPGGTLVRVGEGNRSEAIIPFQNGNAGSLGGGTNIHLHIGTLLADASVPMTLARKIDEALWDLRRKGSSVAFEGA